MSPHAVADKHEVEEAGGVSEVPGEGQEGRPHPLTQTVTPSLLPKNINSYS